MNLKTKLAYRDDKFAENLTENLWTSVCYLTIGKGWRDTMRGTLDSVDDNLFNIKFATTVKIIDYITKL